MDHGTGVFLGQRLSRILPRFKAGKCAALLKLATLLAKILQRRPAHIGEQLLLGVKCRHQAAWHIPFGCIQVFQDSFSCLDQLPQAVKA